MFYDFASGATGALCLMLTERLPCYLSVIHHLSVNISCNELMSCRNNTSVLYSVRSHRKVLFYCFISDSSLFDWQGI